MSHVVAQNTGGYRKTPVLAGEIGARKQHQVQGVPAYGVGDLVLVELRCADGMWRMQAKVVEIWPWGMTRRYLIECGPIRMPVEAHELRWARESEVCGAE